MILCKSPGWLSQCLLPQPFTAAPVAQSHWLDAYRDPPQADRRGDFDSVRLGAARGARRHLRPSPERIREPRRRHQVGRSEMKKDGLDSPADPSRCRTGFAAPRAGDRVPAESIRLDAGARQQRRHAGRHRSRRLAVVRIRRARRRRAGFKGRIVLFNVPFTTYGETVVYRATGRRGGRAGRGRDADPSRRTAGLRTPHTGAARRRRQPQIPAAAITTEDADRLQRMQNAASPVRSASMEAKFLPDADSFNVVGEFRGRELPTRSC